MNPTHDRNDEELQDVKQEAIDSTATAYAADGDLDVEAHLRRELASRGITGADGDMAAEVAQSIRSGHPKVVGEHDGSVRGAP